MTTTLAGDTEVTPVTLDQLTKVDLAGDGVYDKLMAASRLHLEREFQANRIKGSEYSQVYLGALTQVLQTSVAFLLQKDDAYQKALLTQAQIELAKSNQLLIQKQIEQADIEKLLVQAQVDKIKQEIKNLINQDLQTVAQTAVVIQQKINLVSQNVTEGKQQLKLDAETASVKQNTLNAVIEGTNLTKQGLLIDANAAQTLQQTKNLLNQDLQTVQQTALIVQQKANLVTEQATMVKQQAKLTEDTKMVVQQTANAVIEGDNLVRQGCVLDAQFDLLKTQVLSTTAQTALTQQKTSTEKAQVSANGVDDNSVIGKQKLLYAAQTDGFSRDAEQKAAKLLTDTWNVRRTTDDGTVADGTNLLNDATIGRAVSKMLSGIKA